MTLALEAKPTGVAVTAECDLKLAGCTATTPAPVTVVNVGSSQDQFVVCRSCLETMIREGDWQVRHARIAPQIDFLLVDALGRARVAVDVKSAPRSRTVDLARYAASLRRNLLAHAALPDVPYLLMLIVPETGYLWSNPLSPADALPDYEVRLSELEIDARDLPMENGREAEAWTREAVEALLEGRLRPTGLWWTESGLGRAIEGKSLTLSAS